MPVVSPVTQRFGMLLNGRVALWDSAISESRTISVLRPARPFLNLGAIAFAVTSASGNVAGSTHIRTCAISFTFRRIQCLSCSAIATLRFKRLIRLPGSDGSTATGEHLLLYQYLRLPFAFGIFFAIVSIMACGYGLVVASASAFAHAVSVNAGRHPSPWRWMSDKLCKLIMGSGAAR